MIVVDNFDCYCSITIKTDYYLIFSKNRKSDLEYVLKTAFIWPWTCFDNCHMLFDLEHVLKAPQANQIHNIWSCDLWHAQLIMAFHCITFSDHSCVLVMCIMYTLTTDSFDILSWFLIQLISKVFIWIPYIDDWSLFIHVCLKTFITFPFWIKISKPICGFLRCYGWILDILLFMAEW